MEFLQNYWIWILLGIGAVWFLPRRGGHGMGCGMGSHEGHGPRTEDERSARQTSPGGSAEHAGHGSSGRGGAGQGGHRGHGCC